MVHGPPQVLSSTVERHEDFIQIPGVAQPASATPQLSCVVETERLTPLADGFIRNCDASLGEQIFHITETQAESVVEPDSVADDLRVETDIRGSCATGLSSAYFASCDRNLTMPAQELAREGVHTRGGFPGPDSPDNGHPGIEPPLRDDEPVRGGTLHQFDRVVDGRAVGGQRQWWPARKAAASARRPAPSPRVPRSRACPSVWPGREPRRTDGRCPPPAPGPQTASPVPGAGRPYAVPRRTRRRGAAVRGTAVPDVWGRRTGWHRLRLLRQIGDQLVSGLKQFLLVDDVVAVEDGAALVAGQEHGNPLGDARADQVAGGGGGGNRGGSGSAPRPPDRPCATRCASAGLGCRRGGRRAGCLGRGVPAVGSARRQWEVRLGESVPPTSSSALARAG